MRMIYNEGLNSSFCNFIAEKVEYTLFISLEDLMSTELCRYTFIGGGLIMIKPLFNFTNVTSSNPMDNTENNKVLILQYKETTMLSFHSNQPILAYDELQIESVIDGVRYTLYYTYDKITGEPAPFKKTSNGNVTDKYGYYMDSEEA